jgi:hypothetical protein
VFACHAERRVDAQRGGLDSHVERCRRSVGQSRQRGRVDLGDPRRLVEVDELTETAELDAVLDADVLMLVASCVTGKL